MDSENKKNNRVDAVIDEVLASERLKQGAKAVKSGSAVLIKYVLGFGVIGFALLILGVITGVID